MVEFAEIFAELSSEFGSSLFAAVWLDAASHDQDPPTAAGQTESVDLVEGTGSFSLSATVPLTDPQDQPVGDGLVTMTMQASGAPEPIQPPFPSNHHSATSGTIQRFSGQATIVGPGIDVTASGCSGDVTDIHVFEANPRSTITNPQGVTIDCAWEMGDSFAALNAFQDQGGFFADTVELTPGHELFNDSPGTGTLTSESLDFAFGIVNGETGDHSTASASATFGPIGDPVESILVSATRRVKVIEQALAAHGTLEFSAGGSYPLDAAHCRASQSDGHAIVTLPAGPKAGGKPPINDTPDGAVVVEPGSRLNAQNRGAALEPEVPNTTCPSGIGDQMGHTLWYAIAGTGDAVTVDTAGSDFDTVAAVYTRDGDEFSEIGCIDDVLREPAGSTFQAALSFDTTPDQTYYVQVGGFRRFFADTAEYGRLRIAVR